MLPTAWQGVEYAGIPEGGSVAILGLGPIGDMSARIAIFRGAGTVIGVDLVDERLRRANERGVDVIDMRAHDDVASAIRDVTDGRGVDSVIDAVGMEAHGDPLGKLAHQGVSLLPDGIAAKMTEKSGIDRLAALRTAIGAVRRGGTISLVGVYGGMVDPIPMMELFDKQIQLRMGQANVHRWVDDLLPLLEGGHPFGVEGFATDRVPLDQAPEAYASFQEKRDGVVKVLFQP